MTIIFVKGNKLLQGMDFKSLTLEQIMLRLKELSKPGNVEDYYKMVNNSMCCLYLIFFAIIASGLCFVFVVFYSTYDFVLVYIPIENYLGVQETTEIPKLSSF